MKLSELKSLRPDVWKVFKGEVIRILGLSSWEYREKYDVQISGCCSWRKTTQGHAVWNDVNEENFTLFDKWMEEAVKLNEALDKFCFGDDDNISDVKPTKKRKCDELEPLPEWIDGEEKPVHRIIITFTDTTMDIDYGGLNIAEVVAVLEAVKFNLVSKFLKSE
jgi:hypothetical protein